MKRLKVQEDDFLRLFLYGAPGSTKTRTAATAALDERTSPVLHLDIGGNTLSLGDFKQVPDIVRIDKLEELNPVYDWFSKGQKLDHPFPKAMGIEQQYKTLIIDGVSDIQRDSMALVSSNTTVGPGSIPSAMQIQHYGQVLRQMTNFARLFYKLPLHVIITCLEKSERDEGSGLIYVSPGLSGQSSGEVAGYAYSVGRMMHMARVGVSQKKELKEGGADNLDQSVSVVLWRPSSKHVAKDQHGFGVPYMIDPSITKLLNARDATRARGGAYLDEAPDA